jgi:hypothetical protein
MKYQTRESKAGTRPKSNTENKKQMDESCKKEIKQWIKAVKNYKKKKKH